MATIFEDIISGLNATLLWTNPNPTQILNATTLNINIEPYEYFLLKIKPSINYAPSQLPIVIVHIPKTDGAGAFFCSPQTHATNGVWSGDLRQRLLRRDNNNQLFISKGLLYGESTANGSNYSIPVEIYGIKGQIGGIK